MNFSDRGKWDLRFLSLAEHVAQWSKDPSTKVGAVLSQGRKVLGLGYNGFPSGTDDSQDLYENRTLKYPRVVHAELNALLSANRSLTMPGELTLSVWPLYPCADCAGPAINFGVTRVVLPGRALPASNARWTDSNNYAAQLFREASVGVTYYV